MSAPYRALVDAATDRYRVGGRFAHGFARGKLQGDPAFEHLMSEGLLGARSRILDLGCGQGLLAALLLTAEARHHAGDWPADWPAPPSSPEVYGIELMASDVKRAEQALGDSARIVLGDMVDTPYPPSDAVVILDVLHYVDEAAQEHVLDRVHASLLAGRESGAEGGRLLLRVGDAAGGWRFRMSQAVDHLVMTVRGHALGRLYCRSVADWTATLNRRGFKVTPRFMSEGTLFANILLVADLADPARAGARANDAMRVRQPASMDPSGDGVKA